MRPVSHAAVGMCLIASLVSGCTAAPSGNQPDATEQLLPILSRDLQIDYEPLGEPGTVVERGLADEVIRGTLVRVGPGIEVLRDNPTSPGDDTRGVGDPDNDDQRKPRAEQSLWMRFTTLHVTVEQATDDALVGTTLPVQMLTGTLVTNEEIASSFAPTDVVFALAKLPRWDQDEWLTVEVPNGAAPLAESMTPLTGGDWFRGADDEAISPWADEGDGPSEWRQPGGFDQAARAFGVG